MCDMKAPSPYGKLPVTTPAPRNRNIDSTTKEIISSTSQAPPKCDPSNRDLRPSRSGASRSRMAANTARPTSAITAMKSCAKPSRSHRPMIGMAKPVWKSEPYASR